MRIKLKSKLGRPFWRFGKLLSPDNWTEFDVTDEQLKSLERQCASVSEGGALEIDPPFAKPEAPPAPAPVISETATVPPANTPTRRQAAAVKPRGDAK